MAACCKALHASIFSAIDIFLSIGSKRFNFRAAREFVDSTIEQEQLGFLNRSPSHFAEIFCFMH
jgi:hypothetical protein